MIRRLKVNMPEMTPSLARVDRRDGRLLEAVRLAPEPYRLGIHHLALGHADAVTIAMQYEGPAGDEVPLVATHGRGGAIRLCNGPPAVQRARNSNNSNGTQAFDFSRGKCESFSVYCVECNQTPASRLII